MKKIKASKLLKKLESQSKFSKTDTPYQVVLDIIKKSNNTKMVEKGKIIRVIKLQGCGIIDYTNEIRTLLKLLGLEYTYDDGVKKCSLQPVQYIKILTKIVRN